MAESRGRLVRWSSRARPVRCRSLDLLAAFDLPGIAARTFFTAAVGLSGVLHFFGSADRG